LIDRVFYDFSDPLGGQRNPSRIPAGSHVKLAAQYAVRAKQNR
jgi:hypothetical protein